MSGQSDTTERTDFAPRAATGSGNAGWDVEGPALFIADVHNRVERRALEQRIRESATGSASGELPGDVGWITLPLSRYRKPPDPGELIGKLGMPPDTRVVPVRIAWRIPNFDRRKPLGVRHLLFGDPREPGLIRSWFVLRANPRRAVFLAGESATIADLRQRFEEQAPEVDDEEAFANFVLTQAGVALQLAERSLRGRRYKVPHHVAESLRNDRKYRQAIADLAAAEGQPFDQAMLKAGDYLKEIAATPSPLFIDLRARFENKLLSLGYEKKVVCDDGDLARVIDILNRHPAVLLFTHKTYLDGIVVSAVMYENDAPMLHAFGGINMNFAAFGYLMRRSGLIFIRRTFRDNPLYKLVLRHYIGYLMSKRFPMIWAFEGTRSRTGKLVPPRLGLLKYVLEAAWHTDSHNIHIIPVTLSYDLIRDVEEYATEQTGRVKKPESLKWFIGYISSLRQTMGRVYMDFGEPVVLEQVPHPDDRLALPKIAFDVAVQANTVTPITLPAVTCMVLLGAAPRALTLSELQAQALAIVRWAARRGIPISSDFRTESVEHVQVLAEAMEEIGVLMHYDEGTEAVYGIPHDQHPVASYYRNTIIHHFVNKAILELALLRAGDAKREEAPAVFHEETGRLREFFKFEFFYPKKKQFRHELREEMRRVDPEWENRLAEGGRATRALLSDMSPLVAHETLLTFVEAYSVVFTQLARIGSEPAPSEADCVARALKEGRQAWLQRRITSEASIGKILFQNGYRLAENLGFTQSGEESAAGRNQLLRDFKALARRLERIRLTALSDEPQD